MRRTTSLLAMVMIAVFTSPGLATDPAVDDGGGVANRPGFSLRHAPETQLTQATAHNSAVMFGDSETESTGELSMRRAILYSLLLPGLGDWYAGNKERAKAFFVVDAAIWTTFFVFRVQGNQREEGYQNFATEFAGVSGTGHSDEFYSTIGQFNSSGDYEADFKKEHRIDLWPDVGYDAMEKYYVDNRVSDFQDWAWYTWELRVDYREMRSASKLSYRRSGYILALAVANRVVASIFAYQAVKSSRNGDGEGTESSRYRVDFSGSPLAKGGELSAGVSLVRSF
ncbi:MAG: hypothetical protein KAJ17_08855 [Candidatus Krumholzibacteria bacterium]|nr:hypothetical protein [Candidatus Krumholzibacteria bacterium]